MKKLLTFKSNRHGDVNYYLQESDIAAFSVRNNGDVLIYTEETILSIDDSIEGVFNKVSKEKFILITNEEDKVDHYIDSSKIKFFKVSPIEDTHYLSFCFSNTSHSIFIFSQDSTKILNDLGFELC